MTSATGVFVSLQRSEMFIGKNVRPKIFAPPGAKSDSEIFTGAGKSDCAPSELRTKEMTAKL
ncbi:MAG: hypothetical protein JWM21_2749 [Acidobacteria bacterium]|nr:hypothetical protein [Acidobacteriota bacterium]